MFSCGNHTMDVWCWQEFDELGWAHLRLFFKVALLSEIVEKYSLQEWREPDHSPWKDITLEDSNLLLQPAELFGRKFKAMREVNDYLQPSDFLTNDIPLWEKFHILKVKAFGDPKHHLYLTALTYVLATEGANVPVNFENKNRLFFLLQNYWVMFFS